MFDCNGYVNLSKRTYVCLQLGRATELTEKGAVKPEQQGHEKPKKFGTYLTATTAKAVRRFAVEREYRVCHVIEAALKKCLPKKYFS